MFACACFDICSIFMLLFGVLQHIAYTYKPNYTHFSFANSLDAGRAAAICEIARKYYIIK